MDGAPTSGAPQARAGHAAVWSGSEIIVWGGWTDPSNIELNTGGRYKPVSKTWLPTTLEHAPQTRFFNTPHAAVGTGQAMFIYGGFDYPVSLNSAHLYYSKSAGSALAGLIQLLDSLDLPQKTKRPLLSALEAAWRSLEQGHEKAAANQLEAFQQKVQAQLEHSDSELAARLIAAAQAIINRLATN